MAQMAPRNPKRGIRPLWDAGRYIRFLWTSLRDPRLVGIVGAALGMIAIGSLFYWRQEGWEPLDAVYFSVITLATVGYGDLAPTTAAGKLFTIVYVLLSVGLISAIVSVVATIATEEARRRAVAGEGGSGPSPTSTDPRSGLVSADDSREDGSGRSPGR